ncbi:MAG: CPBP family intramembrane metalloprotease [Clostridia bacterium]|nr:CPBP family intramembrane metalloprotease [Clostridia bacterium]
MNDRNQNGNPFENGIFGGTAPLIPPETHSAPAAPTYQTSVPMPNKTPLLEVRHARRQLVSIALAVSFISLFASVAQLVLILLVNTFAPELADANWYLVVLSCAPMYLISMPLSLLIYAIADAKAPEKKSMKFPVWLGLLAICFALTYAGNMIGATVNSIIGALTGEPVANELEELTTNTPLWANLLFMGILAPIMEEIFFRKLVIDRLTVFGDLPAILISGILFGLIHGNFGQFFYAAMMGIVFGFIYLRTGKLRYSIALHMAINLLGGVYTTEMLKMLDLEAFSAAPTDYMMQNPIPVLMMLAYFGFILLCFVTAPIALVLLWKHIRFRKAEQPLSASGWCRALLVNPAVWICLGVVVLLFLA